MSENKGIVVKALIAFVGLGLIYLIMLIPKCEKDKPLTPIETNVIEKTKVVDSLIKQTEIKKAELLPIKQKTKQLEKEVLISKVQKDTVRIIITQDSLINNQNLEIKTLENVVFMQDKTIDQLKGIIELKDMQIEGLEGELKDKDKSTTKAKRQRNLAILGGVVGVIGTILIIK